MVSKRVFTWLCYMSITGASLSCANYEVSVNQQTVYSPAKLFSAYDIADAQLKECVRSSIEEQNVKRASELRTLVCPAGHITSVEGIEVFEGLEIVGLANNKITDVSRLSLLPKLKQLTLKGNMIHQATSLAAVQSIALLDLLDNPVADCQKLKHAFEIRKVGRTPTILCDP